MAKSQLSDSALRAINLSRAARQRLYNAKGQRQINAAEKEIIARDAEIYIILATEQETS